MKEDILEQVVDDYLQSRGFFTRHNIRFRPDESDPDFIRRDDSSFSDIDVIGLNPHARGASRVWAVSCKSWQSGFNIKSKLAELEFDKRRSGRASWKFFRELMVRKWSEAFCETVFKETGSRRFTYVTAVTRISGSLDSSAWERNTKFRKAMRGNPIRLLSLPQMVHDMLPGITKTPAGSDFGRTLQLLKASRYLDDVSRDDSED